jgi:hypothetical protein
MFLSPAFLSDFHMKAYAVKSLCLFFKIQYVAD